MRSFDDGTASQPPNVFTPSFLDRMNVRDEPPTAGEADVAGLWFVEPIPGLGFGLFRAGENLTRGFRPAAVFPDRWLALLAAAVLPGTGRDALLRLNKEPDAEGYGVVLDDGEVVGHFELFDEPLLDAVNVAVALVDRFHGSISMGFGHGKRLESVGPFHDHGFSVQLLEVACDPFPQFGFRGPADSPQ